MSNTNTTPKTNKTIYGSIAMLIALLLSWIKVDIEAAQLEVLIGQAVDAIQVLLGVGGAIMALYGQWQAKRSEK